MPVNRDAKTQTRPNQLYQFNSNTGFTYFWDTTLGQRIARVHSTPEEVSLSKLGVTVERIRSLYDGMDEEYALTTDLTQPLLFVPCGEEYILADGWHRAFHAASIGVDTLLAYYLTQLEANMILMGCIPTPR